MKTVESQDAQTFDLKELIAYYTHDLMSELIFNADFGSQDARNPDLLPPINDHIWLGTLNGMMPSLLPYSMKLLPRISLPWLQDKLRSRAALRDKVAAHVALEPTKREKSEKQNILSRLVRAKDLETSKALSNVAITSEAVGFLIAGSHTSSASLRLLFYHLLHSPEAMSKLNAEIFSVMLLDSPGSIPIFAGLEQRLPYAVACVREAFRISPVFTMPLPRLLTQEDGMQIDGFYIPQGVVHHDHSIWGEDRLSCRPERWLESGKRAPNAADLMHFGAGHRACIGRNIAVMSIMKVLVTILSQHQLEAVDRNEELVIETAGVGEKKGPPMVRRF